MITELKKIRFLYNINSAIKAELQTKKAQKQLEYYRNKAREKKVALLDKDVLRERLKTRLSNRGVSIKPKAPGGLHIFLACRIGGWESVLPKSLRNFGKVTVFDWRKEGFNERDNDWINHRDKMNKSMLDRFRQADREQKVDAVIGYLSGYNTSPGVLKEMGKAGAVVFNFCWDDKLNFPGSEKGGRFTSPAAIAEAVDLNLTNAPDSILKYMVHGGLAMFWPEAAEPELHKPYDIPFDFDVSFVGACYGWRPRFIRDLAKAGVKVECFGNGWRNGRLSNEEMIKLYSRSRINLGFAGVGYSKKLMCLKGRDFEVPMSGGLYLTQNNPELRLVYDVGREILTYENAKDCAEKIKYLLAYPEQAAEIRKAGRKRALKDHTWKRRFYEIFQLVNLLE